MAKAKENSTALYLKMAYMDENRLKNNLGTHEEANSRGEGVDFVRAYYYW